MNGTLVLQLLLTVLALSSSIFSALPLPLLALLSLKSSLLDPLSSLRDWAFPSSSSSDPSAWSEPPWCSWTGITCDPVTFEVTSLDLSRKNLSGFISPEIRLLYRSLVHLNLSGNSFRGPLQPAIFDLRGLETFDISHNDFNSTFPSGISRLRCLTLLDAYSNSFTGAVPRGVTRLRLLEHLNLGGSFFSGNIPSGIGGQPNLRYFHLAGNLLTGRIPHQLGSLPQLEHLEIGYNAYEGALPHDLGHLPRLRYLDVSSANLSGSLPSELGNLTQLETLFLFKNRFSAVIPASFSRLTSLKVLDLSDNCLTGPIPHGFSDLANLTLLSLMNNNLSGEIPFGIGQLPSLEALLLWNNSLTGELPQMLGSNGRLEKVDVSSNSLTGPVPPGLCTGNRLVRLILFSNQFNSVLPAGLAKCTSLWRLRIEGNRISGPIPDGFGLLPNLTYMDLSRNNLSGGIPADLGAAPRLELLNVSQNALYTPLPDNIWGAPSLQIFSATSCGLSGEIPGFGSGCANLYKLEMEGNDLNGSIPADIGHCQKLLSLKLERNHLTGAIPPELAMLPSITEVDVSMNELSGMIPAGLDNCSTLESLNVSYNRLTGPVPSSGAVLRSLHPSSFAGNGGLCGELIGRPCKLDDATSTSWRRDERRDEQRTAKGTAGAAIVWVAAAAIAVGLVVLITAMRWTRRHKKEEAGPGPWRLTAFQRLNFTAEDVAECVSGSNGIIGMGSTGAVYRAEMPGGEVIAVKKLWGRQKDGARLRRSDVHGMVAEVEVLGSVRHRNIVRLLGCCSNRETTLLLYEYMPNGSLEDFLHCREREGGGKEGKLIVDWVTRYQIAVGIAQGVCYLHHDCNPAIVHRDLKPSNILLDAEMEVRVADFGVAKLLQPKGKPSMSVIAGSYGYIAPEYAYTLEVDEKSDIYSFGVVLLEMVSGRRAVEREFGDGNSIVEWVRAKVLKGERGGAWEVLDQACGAAGCKEVREEMMLVLRVALLCTSRNPADRPSMRDVVSMLHEAKPNRKVVVSTAIGQQGGGGGGGAAAAAPVVQKIAA